MIYLFDDKVNRQLDYGWNRERLAKFSTIIKSIQLYSEIEEESIRKEIFSPGNILLFHESFFDNAANNQADATKIRSRLNEAQENKNFRVIYFSGSKSSRKFDENIGHIPVSLLYQNLDVFLRKVEDKQIDLRYLFFGENYKIEEKLISKLEEANRNIEDSIVNFNPNSKNLIALTLKNEIESIFENAHYETFFLEKEYNFDITDEYLSKKVTEWFSIEEFDNIFIPLCFGPILSDYNGLRLALQVRCTDTPNRLKNIFLYSFVDVSYILGNKYFDVLKTRNVCLINYSKSAFQMAPEAPPTLLKLGELKKEIAKIKLDPPKNYEDSHSIANEWAIYRWSSAIKANDEEIEIVTNKVQHQLFFKYLKTIYPVQDITPISEGNLKIKYSGNPKILYIDDEADKGWFEIFCKILDDLNGLGFHYLDGELITLSRKEIIQKSLDIIENKNIDIVLLDFRLHPDDFNTIDIREVTGLKLLKAIKDLNPGIQVVIFSATNKVWNFQALQEAGADGFIIKESPENSVDIGFTNKTIHSLVNSFNVALKRRFLKDFFILTKMVQNQLGKVDTEDDTPYHDFIMDLQKHIKLIESAGRQINLKRSTTLDITFINCYNFLEKFKQFYLNDVNYQLTLGIEEVEMNRYSNYNEIRNDGKFIRNNIRDNPSWFNCLAGLFIDYFSLATVKDQKVANLNRVKDKRNAYIHGNKKQFDQDEVLMILNLCVDITSNLKE